MAAYNLLTGSLDLFPAPSEELCKDMYAECRILSYEEHRRSFRIVCVFHEEWGPARAVVFSSDTRKWQIFPWYDDDADDEDDDEDWPQDGTLVNGFIYWTLDGRDHARVLDIATLEFSRMDMPQLMEEPFRVGKTKDGNLCLACLAIMHLFVWVWRADEHGVKRWMLDNAFPMNMIAETSKVSLEEHDALEVVAIVDGSVYLSTYRETHPTSPCLLLSFCMETLELNTLCPTILHPDVSYPYIMAWPPSLVRNKVNPQVNGA